MTDPGALIVADYQLELRGLLHGPTTRFSWKTTWTGLGVPAVKTTDVALDQQDGDYPGRDALTARILTFPVEWGGQVPIGGGDFRPGTPADVMTDLTSLSSAWATAETDQVQLHMRLPGWGHFYVIGRPRGLVEDLTNLKSGEGAALLTFHALDPTIVLVP